MSDFKLVINSSGLVELSNAANAAIAIPMAQRVAAAAGPGHEVRVTPRQSSQGWARTRVWTATPEAMRSEATDGTLSRALRGL